DLASGEQIYATRFIGDKCYLVTFKQIDPFFVIDLSEPTNPEVLGELKIPGYSTYLHPYDETHIIGIGRDDEKVKISLFDVSDLENPIELSKYEIENDDEDWYWAQSSALYEHKAFLFDKEKNLLVIPVGDYSKESAYVFDISVEGGIELKGTITHDLEVEPEEEYDPWDDDYYYMGNYGNSIKRTLYIEDVLYTVSDNMVKMNDLETLEEINSITIV
ncbi:MAG: beta-propeller domain-containing protein, partial [Thermoplasmatales archaeon]|nr:beta-propeller domain-containing protein [Thermoplasmatales archaeon]